MVLYAPVKKLYVPVKKLRPELSLLGVSAADQNVACRVADGDALTLDCVPARGGRVQEHVHQVVIQQIDLVDVQDTTVGLSQETRLKRLHT